MGQGTLAEVRDWVEDPQGGPRRVWGPSGRSGTGRGTLEEVWDGSGILGEVLDGLRDSRGGLGRVGDPRGGVGLFEEP